MHQFSVLVVLLAVGLAAPAWTQEEDRFGMVGVTADQTAQLNVVNTLTNPSELPCRVSLAFFDRQGNAVGTPADKSLAPGQAESVAADKPKTPPEERFHLWALVRKVDTPDTGSTNAAAFTRRSRCSIIRPGKPVYFLRIPRACKPPRLRTTRATGLLQTISELWSGGLWS